MATATQSAKSRSILIGGIGILAAAVALIAFLSMRADSAELVLFRGTVKNVPNATTVSVYITNVHTAPDHEKIRGATKDVNVANATKYAWKPVKGVLTKVKTTSNPAAQQEVVVRGTLKDNGDVTGVWMVTNYRKALVKGKLQGRTLDTGKKDEGYVTVTVSSSKFLGVTKPRPFKETIWKDTDVRFRVDGNTDITALGKSKAFDEVTASQQNVEMEIDMLEEAILEVKKFKEV